MKTVEITHKMLFDVLDKEVLYFGAFQGEAPDEKCAMCVLGHLLVTLGSENVFMDGIAITKNNYIADSVEKADYEIEKILYKGENYLGAISIYFESLSNENNYASEYNSEGSIEASLNVNEEVREFILKKIPKTFSVNYSPTPAI